MGITDPMKIKLSWMRSSLWNLVEVHRGDLLLQERIHLILLEWQPMFSKQQKNL